MSMSMKWVHCNTVTKWDWNDEARPGLYSEEVQRGLMIRQHAEIKRSRKHVLFWESRGRLASACQEEEVGVKEGFWNRHEEGHWWVWTHRDQQTTGRIRFSRHGDSVSSQHRLTLQEIRPRAGPDPAQASSWVSFRVTRDCTNEHGKFNYPLQLSPPSL